MHPSNLNSHALGRTFIPHLFKPEGLEKLFVSLIDRLHRGKLTVHFPSGNAYSLSGSQDTIDGQQFHATWNLKSYRAIRRMLRSQSVGFAEAFMEGEFDSPDLTHFLELMASNMDTLEAAVGNWKIVQAWNRVQHLLRSNSRRGSRRNIAYHYDLGNDFYRLWLDSSMTYSSGIFDEQHQNLVDAQENKYRQLAEELAACSPAAGDVSLAAA